MVEDIGSTADLYCEHGGGNNNTTRPPEIQNHIIADNTIFNNIHQVGLWTLGRVLQHNHIQMKQVYRVLFERNNRVKEQHYEYVQVSTMLWIYYHISTV